MEANGIVEFFFRFPLGSNTFLQASLATKCTKLQWKNKAHKVGNIAHFKAEKFIWKLARNMVLVSSKVRFLVKKGDWVRFLSFFPILWTRYLKNPKITSFTRKVNKSGYFQEVRSILSVLSSPKSLQVPREICIFFEKATIFL